MRITKAQHCPTVAIFLSALVVMALAAGCAPKTITPTGDDLTTTTVSVPIGDDLTTPIAEGHIESMYRNDVPISILKGTYTTDFSAMVKVLDVMDTRIVRVEILSPTTFEQQLSYTGYLYLCAPLSEKAEKLADGTVVYSGTGYPQIMVGRSYDVVGVLQPDYQDYPFVYIPTASEFQQNPDDSVNNQMLLAAARSFAEQAVAAGDHHMTRQPAITVSSNQVLAGKVEALMTIEAMYVLNGGPVDLQPMIAGELQYLQNHGTPLSAATKAVENDIAGRRGTIEHAMSVPSGVSYRIKVVGDVDTAGTIDASSLQVYVDNGVNGKNYVSAVGFLDDIRSRRATVAQGYAKAVSIAAAAKAP